MCVLLKLKAYAVVVARLVHLTNCSLQNFKTDLQIQIMVGASFFFNRTPIKIRNFHLVISFVFKPNHSSDFLEGKRILNHLFRSQVNRSATLWWLNKSSSQNISCQNCLLNSCQNCLQTSSITITRKEKCMRFFLLILDCGMIPTIYSVHCPSRNRSWFWRWGGCSGGLLAGWRLALDHIMTDVMLMRGVQRRVCGCGRCAGQ